MKTFALLAIMLLVFGLSACGKKPAWVDPPPGSPKELPSYPAPTTAAE